MMADKSKASHFKKSTNLKLLNQTVHYKSMLDEARTDKFSVEYDRKGQGEVGGAGANSDQFLLIFGLKTFGVQTV